MQINIDDFIAYHREELEMGRKALKKREKQMNKLKMKGKDKDPSGKSGTSDHVEHLTTSNDEPVLPTNFVPATNAVNVSVPGNAEGSCAGYHQSLFVVGDEGATAAIKKQTFETEVKDTSQSNQHLVKVPYMIPVTTGNRGLYFKDDEPVGLVFESHEGNRRKLIAERRADYLKFLAQKEKIEKEKLARKLELSRDKANSPHSFHASNDYNEMVKKKLDEERQYRDSNFHLPSDGVFNFSSIKRKQDDKLEVQTEVEALDHHQRSAKESSAPTFSSSFVTLPEICLPTAPVMQTYSAPSKTRNMSQLPPLHHRTNSFSNILGVSTPGTVQGSYARRRAMHNNIQPHKQARNRNKEKFMDETEDGFVGASASFADLYEEVVKDVYQQVLGMDLANQCVETYDANCGRENKGKLISKMKAVRDADLQFLERRLLHNSLQVIKEKVTEKLQEIALKNLTPDIKEELVQHAEQQRDFQQSVALSESSWPPGCRPSDIDLIIDRALLKVAFGKKSSAVLSKLLELRDDELEEFLKIMEEQIAANSALRNKRLGRNQVQEGSSKKPVQHEMEVKFTQKPVVSAKHGSPPNFSNMRTGGGGEPVRDGLGNIITSRTARNSIIYPESGDNLDDKKKLDEKRRNTLAYREDLLKQLHERKLAMQIAKERDLLEELRVNAEIEEYRLKMQRQYEEEQERRRQKEKELRNKMEKRLQLTEARRIEEEKRIAEEAEKRRSQKRNRINVGTSPMFETGERTKSPPVPALRAQELLDNMQQIDLPPVDRATVANVQQHEALGKLSDVRRFAAQEQKQRVDNTKKNNSYKVMDRHVVQDDSDDDDDDDRQLRQ